MPWSYCNIVFTVFKIGSLNTFRSTGLNVQLRNRVLISFITSDRCLMGLSVDLAIIAFVL